MTCFTLIGGCRSLVLGWRREEHTLAVSWPSHSQTRNGKHHDKWEQEWEASSLPILSSWSHKIQVVIRFLKAFGMAQIDFLLYWKKNALQGWNSTFLLQPQRKMYLKKVLALCLWRKHCAEECSELDSFMGNGQPFTSSNKSKQLSLCRSWTLFCLSRLNSAYYPSVFRVALKTNSGCKKAVRFCDSFHINSEHNKCDWNESKKEEV